MSNEEQMSNEEHILYQNPYDDEQYKVKSGPLTLVVVDSDLANDREMLEAARMQPSISIKQIREGIENEEEERRKIGQELRLQAMSMISCLACKNIRREGTSDRTLLPIFSCASGKSGQGDKKFTLPIAFEAPCKSCGMRCGWQAYSIIARECPGAEPIHPSLRPEATERLCEIPYACPERVENKILSISARRIETEDGLHYYGLLFVLKPIPEWNDYNENMIIKRVALQLLRDYGIEYVEWQSNLDIVKEDEIFLRGVTVLVLPEKEEAFKQLLSKYPYKKEEGAVDE